MIKITIVEDNLSEAEEIRSYFCRLENQSGRKFSIKHYKDAVSFLSEYDCGCDIVLMDIEMPDLNGMEAAKKLRKIDKEVILIFITNMVQFAVSGYEVDAYAFIVKPVSYYSFAIKLDRAFNKLEIMRRSKEEISLPNKNGVKRLSIPSIKYVEVRGHHLYYHTFDGVEDVCGNLNEVEERLKSFHFARCNICYLVNLKYVTEVKGNVVSVSGEELQMSRRKRNSFIDSLTLYLGDN